MNIDNMINSFIDKVGKITYSMYGSRNFSDGTCDCSGAVYYGLRNGGGSNLGYIPSTETLHDYLINNGFTLISENNNWNAQCGDVVIWGKKGYSAGAGGHTGIMVGHNNWVECTAYKNLGVTVQPYYNRWLMNDRPYFYVYRQNDITTNITPLEVEKMKIIIIQQDANYYNVKYKAGTAFVLNGEDLRHIERPQTLVNLKVLGVNEYKMNQIDLLYIIQDMGLKII